MGKKSILLVDDEDSMRQLLSTILSAKYNVMVAKNGFHAISLLSEGNMPDLIVSDIVMPGLSGIDLLFHLRKSGLYRDIPFIVLSGSQSTEDQLFCSHFGVQAYLTKPFDPQELQNQVKTVIG
jgi:two-component system, chemotaxis family, chemotaxis protein CheY